jgi:hypothetical protein
MSAWIERVRSPSHKRSGIFRQRRWTPILIALALAAFAIFASCYLREPILRAAGWALVVSELVAPADIIVLAVDSEAAGALEAADLVQSGISKRVAVFDDPPAEKSTSSSAEGYHTRMKGQGRFAN